MKTLFMRLLFTAFLCLLASSSFAEDLKIASWNIKDLRIKNPHRDTEVYKILRKYVADNPADIWVLQEVHNKRVLKKVFSRKKYVLECENRKGQHRVCAAFRKGKGIRFVRHKDVKAIGINNSGLRGGLDFTIHFHKQKLRVLGVHLKSGCFQADPKRSKNRKCGVLAKQIPPLEKWIDDRAIESTPFIILGDFNRRLTKKRDVIWKDLDDGIPEKMDLTNLAGKKKNPCWNGRYPDFIDHIVVGRRALKKFVPKSFGVYRFDKDARRETHSDHCPIFASFRF